jgi:hypothetical protein
MTKVVTADAAPTVELDLPRYFFDVCQGHRTPDEDGTELSGIAAVQREAVSLLGGLLRDDPVGFWKEDDLAVEVRDDAGLMLFTIYVDAVLAPALLTSTDDLVGKLP